MDSIAIGIAWCVAWGDRRSLALRRSIPSRAIAPYAQLVVFYYLYKFQVF
jgi:hypothetical protein